MSDTTTETTTSATDTKPNREQELEAKLAKLEAAEKERKAAEKKKADDAKYAADKSAMEKAAEEGRAKEALAKAAADLEAANKQKAEYEEAMRAQFDAIYTALPDGSKKKIDAIKEAVPITKLISFAQMEANEHGANVKAPPTANPGTPNKDKTKRAIDSEALAILETLGVSPEVAQTVPVEIDPATGKKKYVMPIADLIKRWKANAPPTRKLTEKAAMERDGRI